MFKASLVTNDLVQELKWHKELREEFARDEDEVLSRFPLTERELAAIHERDFLTLYGLGLHPYLGGQFARLLYGNRAGAEANAAVDKLVESISGGSEPDIVEA